MSVSPPPALGARPGRIRVIWLVRLAVSALVLTLLFRIVPAREIWREARQLPPALWLGGLAVFLAGHAAAAAKWRLLIGPGVSYTEAFRAHLAGLGANLCLPGVAGGDVVRAGLVFRKAKDPARLAAGSVADRFLDTLGLMIIAGAGGLAAFGAAAGRSHMMLAGAVGLVVLVAGLAVVFAAARMLAARPLTGKIGRMVGAVARAVSDLAREPGRLALCLTLSLAIQAVFVGVNIAFAAAAHVDAPAAAWFFAWAGAKIIAIAPISLGGLGVREASTAGLLAPFGADPARVIAVGLIWQTVLYASGLIGLVVQGVWKPDRTAAAPPAPHDVSIEPSL